MGAIRTSRSGRPDAGSGQPYGGLGRGSCWPSAGRWEPPVVTEPRHELPAHDPTFHQYASAWLLRWKAGEFGTVPDEASVVDMRDWRLAKHLLRYFGALPVDNEHFTIQRCAEFKADMLGEAARLADVHREFDLAKLPVADAIRAGAASRRSPTSAPARTRTIRRKAAPLAPRSIQMLTRAVAHILDAAVLDRLLASNAARGKHMSI